MTAQSAPGGVRVAHWPQGLTLAAQAVLPTMGALLLVPVLPLIVAEYGAMPNAAYWIPAMLTVPGLCIALFSPLAGWMGDRFGRRTPLIGALAIYGIAGLAPLMLSGFAAIFIARVVLGMCEAAIITLSATMIGDYFVGRQRDRLLALISTMASLSAIVFLSVSGVLGQALGWRGPTLVYGIAFIFLPAMLLLTWDPGNHAPVSRAADRQPLVEGSVVQPEIEVFPWRHMAVVVGTTLFGSTLFYVLVMQGSLGLAALGVSDPQRIGFLTAIASIAVPIGTVAFWRVSHWRPSTLLAIEFTIIGLACLGVGHAGTDWQLTAAAAMGLFACGLLLPTLMTWTMRDLSFQARARGTGIFQSSFAFGQFLSGVIMPFLTLNLTGDILRSFAALGGVALAFGAVMSIHATRARSLPSIPIH